MKKFIKNNLFKIIASISFGIAAVVFASLILPLRRGGNSVTATLFIVFYALFFIGSIILGTLLSIKIKKDSTIETNTKTKFMLVYYFSSIVFLSVVLTSIFAIINAVNPESIFLKQGILSICLVLAYYLGFSLPVLINVNFLK